MWMQLIFWSALLALAIVLGMALIVYHAVERLSGASDLFKNAHPPDTTDSSDWSKTYTEADVWAKAQGLTPFDCLDFYGLIEEEPIHIGSWKDPAGTYYLVLYFFMEKTWFDLTSLLNSTGYLTTSNQRDALTLPETENTYIQVFADAPLSMLYQRHQDGLRYLCEQLKTEPVLSPLSLRNLMIQAMEKQTASIKAEPFWYLNGAIWYFGRRLWRNNQTVQQLYSPDLLTSG
jgi:hypothetical protein